MKICAITMVYRDYWALSQWYAHYGRHLGEDNLFIVAHGFDPMVQTLCPKASVLTLPRDSLKGFDRVRSAMLNALQNALGQVYEWVIRTDADELVCIDPSEHGSFQDLLSRQDASASFALGFNVIEMDGDIVLGHEEPVLSKRSSVVFSGHYSKAWAVNGAVTMDRHGIRVRPGRVADFGYSLGRGVYLAHLKFANRAVMAQANDTRMSMALIGERGLPGKSWEDADARADKYFRLVDAMPLTDWNIAMPMALAALQSPVRKPKNGLVRSLSLRFNFRTVLPDWFKTY